MMLAENSVIVCNLLKITKSVHIRIQGRTFIRVLGMGRA